LAYKRRKHPDAIEQGQRLQRIRLAAGLSQSQLARAADVPVRTVQCWEIGQRRMLFAAACRIAVALDIDLNDLAGIAPAPRRKKGSK
jgi:transcriptional regulator with XRE-family HTH domain